MNARRPAAVLLATLATMSLSFMAAPAANALPGGEPATQHCAPSTNGHDGVKVEAEDSPRTIKVYDVSTGTYVAVRVVVSGPYLKLESADPKLELVGASWCVKAGTEVNYGDGTWGKSDIYNVKCKLKDISYVVVYWVKTKEKCPTY